MHEADQAAGARPQQHVRAWDVRGWGHDAFRSTQLFVVRPRRPTEDTQGPTAVDSPAPITARKALVREPWRTQNRRSRGRCIAGDERTPVPVGRTRAAWCLSDRRDDRSVRSLVPGADASLRWSSLNVVA